MEDKKVRMMSGLLVVVVVLGQIQVGAATICCPTIFTRVMYNRCRGDGGSQSVCAEGARCKIVDLDCPDGYTHDILENTSSVSKYCKLGCVSSVCAAITNLQHSDASEVVNGAVEKCTSACSAFCTKGAVETA